MKPVAEEFEEIAKRLKEIQEEKADPRPADDLPSDVEATASLSIGEYWARYGQQMADRIVQSLPTEKSYSDGEIWSSYAPYPADMERPMTTPVPPSIYGDPFWDALVRNGVIKIGEC